MGALTVAEAYGPTLEQALDAMLAPAPARADPRRDRHPGTCVICAGPAYRVELADRSTMAVCRDCGASAHAGPPPATGRPSLRLVH